MNAGCAGKTARSLENVCHTRATYHNKALYKSTFTFTKNIAYHITKVMIVHADKFMVIGNSKNSRVLNFMILLKSQKFEAREIYVFYSSFSYNTMCHFSWLQTYILHQYTYFVKWLIVSNHNFTALSFIKYFLYLLQSSRSEDTVYSVVAKTLHFQRFAMCIFYTKMCILCHVTCCFLIREGIICTVIHANNCCTLSKQPHLFSHRKNSAHRVIIWTKTNCTQDNVRHRIHTPAVM